MLLLIVFLTVQQHNTWNMYYNTPALIFHYADFKVQCIWNAAWLDLICFKSVIGLINVLNHPSPLTLVRERTDVRALHNWPCIFIFASNGCWEGEGGCWASVADKRHARLHMQGLGFTWMISNPDKYEGWIVWRGDSNSWLWHREWLSILCLHYNTTTADEPAEDCGETESGSVSPDV